jgi:cytochrome c-type biogenesis protein CcmF
VTAAALIGAGMRAFYAIMSFSLCVFVTVTIVAEFAKATAIRARNSGEGPLTALVNLTLRNKRRYGGYIVHFAVVVIFVGLTGNAFNQEASRTMRPGDSLEIGRYRLKMVDYKEGEDPNYRYAVVTMEAYRDGRLLEVMKPEKRAYKLGEATMTEVALHSTPREDLYVIYAGPANDGQGHEITAHVNPLVFWVWLGALIMVFGTLITLLPDRRIGVPEVRLDLGAAASAGEETARAR